MEEKRTHLKSSIEMIVFAQYLFEQQWSSLLASAHSRGIKVLGDVPFYVLHDSADTWAHGDFFRVDKDGRASLVGGVPPDAFSKTGQRWGNPVYDWGRLEEAGYEWWMDRVKRGLELADMLRLDHFRGYVSYWEIPADEETAMNGKWVALPKSFFDSFRSSFPDLPFVAEDLGVITSEVIEARERLGIPGTKVLQFAFDGTPDNIHLPSNYPTNSFVYTGTHDTNTTRGWFSVEATTSEKEVLEKYIGHPVTVESVADEFIAMAMESAAEVSIIPMQDILSLGGEARMNNPSTSSGNWAWRDIPEELSEEAFTHLAARTAASGRC